MRAHHDEYGKNLLQEILGDNRWGNWFSEKDRSVLFGNVPAKLDGVIRTPDRSSVECAVEIEATNFKQMRGALVGLANHPAPKKLFVIIKAQKEVVERTSEEIESHCLAVWNSLRTNPTEAFRIVILQGTGETQTPEIDKDLLRRGLIELNIG